VSPSRDPVVVAEQYASEANLEARRAFYDEVEGEDARDVLWRLLGERRPRHVLEVGGGPGELAQRIQDELGAEVSFVDISPRMVELARARGVLAAQVGDVQALPFADATFDAAVAAWMLYHVPDLGCALRELARVLEPGGRLFAVTTAVDHLRELRELVRVPPGYEEAFNRENGEEWLLRWFSRVERRDVDVAVTVREREKLVAYQRSMSVPSRPVPEDVELPLVVHGRVTIFVATK
jgi:SAM-dependent methyltransferase